MPLAVAHGAIDDAVLSNEADGTDWPGYSRTFTEQRFSPLREINTGNVQRLGLAWSLDVPDVWNVSTAPLAADGVVYFAAGYSIVYAVDAASGRLLWQYDPKVTGFKMRLAWGIRGLALWDDKVYVGTQDGRLLAINANTGKLAWEVLTTEPGDIRYITGPPRVFDGKVVIGHAGADFGPVRGYVTAYDAQTGKQLWRFHTVPGDPARGFENKAMEMAAKTWTGEWWKLGGGGTVWNAMTYDPEFNRLYIGTGNGAPWNRKIRSPGGGDNLFLCSIVALDADTGEYVWHYQTTPGESWDFNSSMDMVLATLPIDGKPRKLLLHAPKNGFFYVLDRQNGKLLSAEKFAKVTWAERIDLATGRPIEAPNARYESGETLIWPGTFGAHSWLPMAFSPDTGLVYIPGRDLPGYYNDKGIDPVSWRQQSPNAVDLRLRDMQPGIGQGFLVAWNPLTQREAWRAITPSATAGGVMATHGGLVFQPQADGQFVARDAASGKVLWSYDMHVGSQAPPITYSVRGKQYVSVLAGWAGQLMMLGSISAQYGWIGREHPPRLLTFALDGKAKLPQTAPPARPVPVDDPNFKIDASMVEQGRALFGYCVMCHGLDAVAGGYAPDLRASSLVLSREAFDAVVRGGILEGRGMPRFDELTPAQLDSLQHYLRARARESLKAASESKAAAKASGRP